MQPEYILTNFGEISAIFAGFSGIVEALGARSVSELPLTSRFRFANLLVNSVSTCLLAFVPLVLGTFSMASSLVWAWSSATLAAFALLFLMARAAMARRVRVAQVTLGRRWMTVLYRWGLASICVTQCVNIIGWPLNRSPALYVTGLFGLLILSGLQFLLLALDSTPAEE